MEQLVQHLRDLNHLSVSKDASAKKMQLAANVVRDNFKTFDKQCLKQLTDQEIYRKKYSELWEIFQSGYESTDLKIQKAGKKALGELLSLVEAHYRISVETPGNLIKSIQCCKHIDQLQQLYDGRVIQGLHVPGLESRFCNAELRSEHPLGSINWRSTYEDKEQYLKQKQIADRVALALTIILSILGIGLIAGIAMMMILPAMPLAAFIPTLAVFSILGGYTESFVYHSYLKRFCRQCVRGFFDTIDNHILNREAKKIGKDHRRELTDDEKKDLLKANRTEAGIKKTLAVLSIPLGIGAGIGFAGLGFSHIISLLPMIGVTTGIVGVAAPWALAVVVGPLYALVMYSMLHRAIKNNIFLQIKEHIVDLFGFKGEWSSASTSERSKHIALCILKGLGFAVVFGISVLATIFTAGAWLESSVGFFATGLGVVNLVANKIGLGIAAVFLSSNFWFSVENALNTAKELSNVTWKKIIAGISYGIKHPMQVLKGVLNFIPFVVHVSGTAAVATQGAEAFALKGLLGPSKLLNQIVAGTTEFAEETLVDAKEALINPMKKHKHDNAHEHDHSHGDVWSTGKAAGKWFTALPGKMGLFAKSESDDVQMENPVELRPYRINQNG